MGSHPCERHAGDLTHRLQPEQCLAGADPLMDADPFSVERRERFGKGCRERREVEQQHVGGAIGVDEFEQLGRAFDGADHVGAGLGREVPFGERHRLTVTDQQHP